MRYPEVEVMNLGKATDASLFFRIDQQVKDQFEQLYATMGIKASDALRMFVYKSLSVGGLPFEMCAATHSAEVRTALQGLEYPRAETNVNAQIVQNLRNRLNMREMDPAEAIEKARGCLAAYPQMSVDNFLARMRADKELER